MLRKSRALLVAALAALSVMALSVPAFAQTTPTDEANSAISSAASTATGLITTNIPVILGVTGAMVALVFGRKLLRKVFSG